MTTGLVLSGGGMRGAAHIGAIKALEEHDIFPTHIAGTSAGAVVGALYAYGHSCEDMLTFLKGINILDIKKYALNKPGLIDAEKFYPGFKTCLKNDDFSSLKKQLTITATNILNGKLEIFKTGELIRPVLASAAIPGIFAPVKINDSYYVDGGTLNNFPVELLKSTCDKIIGIYVNSFDDIKIKDLKHSYNVIERAFIIKSVDEDLKKFNDCDLIISPKGLNKFGVFDKNHLNDIFNLGYEATKKELTNNNKFSMKTMAD
ncbi:patatin [Yeosuana aromativorans]|uniref:Patatin n=1 Tax=Yeosuana aromativorans TaxID=288019 RepID=A0A8J3BLS0_9FLAO|nr:patatin-like phospholipase family protein [Yeosuana aromativorans]GGK18280.1 patatin [Yeosuana aromativorans]